MIAPSAMQQCYPNRSRQYEGGPDIEFVTVALSAAANFVTRDMLVRFQRAWQIIGVASITSIYSTSGVYIHFNPLCLPQPGANQITPLGTEAWFTLADSTSSTRSIGRYIRFSKAVQQFYLDTDHPAGASPPTYSITFFGTNDLEAGVLSRS